MMRRNFLKILTSFLFAIAVLGISGCCTTLQCLDKKSGKDRIRVKARAIGLGVVHNDRVDSKIKDRTDWKYIELSQPGKLKVQLHWDAPKTELTLGVYDVMGVLIQAGRPWGTSGSHAVIAIEKAGRYYIKVQAKSRKDGSHYSIRTSFRADGGGSGTCHKCQIGESKCLGKSSVIICEKISESCNAWSKTQPCHGRCINGKCADCSSSCRAGERQCLDRSHYRVCRRSGSSCPRWTSKLRCTKGRQCMNGRCSTGERRAAPPVAKPKKRPGCIKIKVISMYKYRGRNTLHLQMGEEKVNAGQVGYLLRGNSDKRVPGGEVRVLRISGNFAIATTGLERLGNNRTVCIKR